MKIWILSIKPAFKPAFLTVVAVIVSLAIAFLLISLQSGISFVDIWRAYYLSTFGSATAFTRVLVKTAHICTLAIGLSIAFRSGLWNLGAVGQMALGLIATAGVGLFLNFSPFLTIPLSYILSFFVGFSVAGAIGWLKAKWDVNEMFLTLMSSFILVAVLTYLIASPWGEEGVAEARTATMPVLFPYVYSQLTLVIVVPLVLMVIAYIFLNKTTLGYELKVVGSGKEIARNQGIDITRALILSLALSGGICALAGTGQVLGDMTRVIEGMPGNFGFYAFPASLMVSNRPELVFFSSFFLTVILMGSLGLTSLGINPRFGEAMIGLVFIISLFTTVVWRKK